MDPDACLKEILEELKGWRGASYDRTVELLTALADWLAGGGYDPRGIGGHDWTEVLEGAYAFLAAIPPEEYLEGEEYLMDTIEGLVGDEADGCPWISQALSGLRNAVEAW